MKSETKSSGVHCTDSRKGERGQGKLNLLIFLAVAMTVGYVLYQYCPVAYQAWLYKDLMQHDVDVAAVEGYDAAWVKNQLAKSAAEYSVPPDATILPAQRDGRIEATVKFKKAIPLPGYVYEYSFEHTARSTQFLLSK
jgi:hypothetical protein